MSRESAVLNAAELAARFRRSLWWSRISPRRRRAPISGSGRGRRSIAGLFAREPKNLAGKAAILAPTTGTRQLGWRETENTRLAGFSRISTDRGGFVCPSLRNYTPSPMCATLCRSQRASCGKCWRILE